MKALLLFAIMTQVLLFFNLIETKNDFGILAASIVFFVLTFLWWEEMSQEKGK